MSLLSPLKYFVLRAFMDLRDLALGPRYRIEGARLSLPRGGNAFIKLALISDAYERDEREMIKAFLPPDLPVIELGGSYGVVSFTIRRCLMADQTLVVVEANPAVLPICQANVAVAGATDRTRVVHAALAYGDSTVRFKITGNVHTSHLVFDGSTGPGIVDVPSANLQSLRETNAITGPYSLVCDIEGAELLMLRNDAQALSDCHLLIMETHPDAYAAMDGSLAEVFGHLDRLGFRVFNKRTDVVMARRA